MPSSQSQSYRLEAKVNGQWQTLCTITASNHREAFAKAMLLLSPDLYDKPIRLELIESSRNKSN